MRENNVRKPVSIPKHVFHISDDDGNSKNFIVKQTDKNVLYTADDVEAVLDACQYVIHDALKHGEEVSINGIGKLCLKYQKERMSHNVVEKEMVKIEGHYSPKFVSGNELKRCAQIYEQSLKDRDINKPLPVFPEEDE